MFNFKTTRGSFTFLKRFRKYEKNKKLRAGIWANIHIKKKYICKKKKSLGADTVSLRLGR
jgi:hypothetical protein